MGDFRIFRLCKIQCSTQYIVDERGSRTVINVFMAPEICILCCDFLIRQLAQEMKEVAAQRQQEEEAFYRQQELMVDAENKRRWMIGQEEQKLADQRSRFVCLKE